MKIAIINDVHIGKPLERNHNRRAASHLAAEVLPQVLSHIVRQHAPDLLIQMGDLIRSESRLVDCKNYSVGIAQFIALGCPVLHLIGNHELKRMTREDIQRIWRESGIEQDTYGIQEYKELTLIWLGLEYQPDQLITHRLPEEQLSWLDATLKKINRPTLIFTHCAMDDHDVSGNYFYEGYEDKTTYGFFFENHQQVRQVISQYPHVEMIVQAHLHYFHTKLINHIPYVTCPALGDNICAPTYSDHIPEIYSILAIQPDRLTLKAYSREYCFAGMEWDRSQLS